MTSVLSNVASGGAVPAQLPRLGQIAFINCLPVVLPVEKGHVDVAAQVVYASPTELNLSYAKGALDLGAMSSFFYLDNGGMELIPDLSISSDGQVGSVLFFSKVSTHNLNGARVSVPASSATSVNLLRILLLEQLGVKPEFVVEAEPDLDDGKTMAALLIGDRALAFDGDWSNRFWRADLGQWWRIQTGLPMVFGVWAARRHWAAAHQEQLLAISQALRSSADLGLSTLFPLVMNEARNRTALPPNRIQRYYHEELNFQLTPRHLKGLELFRQLCQQYGLLS